MALKTLKKGKGVAKISKTSTRTSFSPKGGSSWAKYAVSIIILALIAFTVFYIVQISRGAFQKRETYADERKQIILIYSERCPHCVDFKPIFNECSKEFPEADFKMYESGHEDAKQFQVSGVPTVLVLSGDGTVEANLVGKRSKETFTQELTAFLRP